MIIPRLFHGFDGLIHNHLIGVFGCESDVAALKRRGAGQYDIGMLGQCIPAPLVDDDGFGFGPGPAQPVEVLMMMEWVAAGPPDQFRVRILIGLSVVVETSAGIIQHFCKTRNRDEARYLVSPLWERSILHLFTVQSD